MEKFSLIIIDRQKDFVKPDGSLYVKGSENSEIATLMFIDKNHEFIKEVVFTIDWHSTNHCSFKHNGGIWPDHCKQYTEGAGISDSIMNKVNEYGIPVKIFIKGNVDDTEEYGAFDIMGVFGEENGELKCVANNIARNCMVKFDTNNLVVCGIAGDYCVKSSIENLLKFNGPFKLNIKVFMDGISSIDDGTTIRNFIKENNLEVV